MSTLVFVDTNILLDFYRVTGRQGDLSILYHIDANHARIITTMQVEMEFKKNRPSVVLETYRNLKNPDWSSLSLPAYLSESRQSAGLNTSRNEIERRLKSLRIRIRNILERPARYDPVYKAAQRLFRSECEHHLTRKRTERRAVRRRAFRRFMQGYPPRKGSDTSIGDALNWEWILDCARTSGCDIVIVSRDSDFGVSFEKKVILNDWLLHEFKDRVSRRRKITLTDRLTEALKLAKIRVSKSEERAEASLLEELRAAPGLVPGAVSGHGGHLSPDWTRLWSSWVFGSERRPEPAKGSERE